jgi:hypothetical protein
MAITYYMLQIPAFLLFILISSGGAVFAILATFFSHNEVTGFLFLAIASFYALLLSFVVFVVWDQLNETRGNVSKEGSSAMGLYRDIKFYPDTLESKQLMSTYLDFVYNVIDEEFPNMGIMKPSRRTPESLDKVFFKMEHLNPKNSFQIQLVAEMYNHLNELAIYRGLRTASMETEIPPPMWLPMVIGAIITIFCALLLDIEHTRMHLALNGLLGAFIGMFFFIIIILDHPFTGSLSIKPKAYKQIFTMEKWANDANSQKMHTNLNKQQSK